jgi:hypothetical protein
MAVRNVFPTSLLLACVPGSNDNSYWFVTRHFAGRFAIFFPACGLFPQKLVA